MSDECVCVVTAAEEVVLRNQRANGRKCCGLNEIQRASQRHSVTVSQCERHSGVCLVFWFVQVDAETSDQHQTVSTLNQRNVLIFKIKFVSPVRRCSLISYKHLFVPQSCV